MTSPTGVFARYPGSSGDEAVAPDGSVRAAYRPVARVLDELGGVGLTAVLGAAAQERRIRGVVLGSYVDGRLDERPVPFCPVPRVLSATDWARVSLGVEQRTRALNAFLADVYRPAGRRRTDVDQHPAVVRAGIVPEWIVTASPGHRPAAVGFAAAGRQRITVSGLDLLHGPDGWVALEDHLRAPSGIGYALTNRDSGRAALPRLYADAGAAGLVEPGEAVALLRAALADAAPAGCTGDPQLGLLIDGPHDRASFEHQLLAEAMGVPIATPDRLWPTPGGGVAVEVDGERLPVDVLYQRIDEADLAAHRTATGTPVDVLLGEAVRAGKLSLANVPGNGVADDKATYRYVPDMIRFYLGEEPVLGTVPTWLLGDGDDFAQVRDRLHELVITPVEGYGGRGVVFGPLCSAAQLAELRAEVFAAPHRFVVQEPVDSSTVPTAVDGVVAPRRAALRVLAVAGTTTRALPAPLTRVAPTEGSLPVDATQGGTTKDTWILPT